MRLCLSLRMGEGSPAQAWLNVKGGLRVIALHIFHPEGWTPKNDAIMEAVVKQARTTSHPWLVACDANVDGGGFKRGSRRNAGKFRR